MRYTDTHYTFIQVVKNKRLLKNDIEKYTILFIASTEKIKGQYIVI